jgi:hypothetical protein
MVLLPDPPVHLVAGLAERAADRSAAGLPFLATSLALRRAAAAAADPGAPDVLGHALLSVLAEALGEPAPDELRAAAVALGSARGGVEQQPALARAWATWRDAAPLVLPSARGPQLVPELRFAIEGGEPHVAGMRIHAIE